MRRFRMAFKLAILLLIISLVPLILFYVMSQENVRLFLEVQKTSVDAQSAVYILEMLLRRQQVSLVIVTFFALILATLASILLHRSIVQPIQRLQLNARQLLAGRFPLFELPGAEPELSELAEVLRETTTGLHALTIEADQHGKEVEQLYTEATRRAMALQTIHNVSQRISTILDIDDLLSEIVELIRTGFDYDRVHLFTLNHPTHEIVFCTGSGRAGRLGAELGERIRIGQESAVGHVASTGKPLLIQDLERESRYRVDTVAEAGVYTPPAETRSELVVPLSSGGQVIGVLSVQSDRSNALSNDDLFVVQELAFQAAGAIINARLYEEAFRRAEEVMALMMTSLAMSSAPDLDVRLETIAHHARQLIDADGCTVYRLDVQVNVLYPLILLDPRGKEWMASPLPAGVGIEGQVAQSGRGEIVNHSERDPRLLQTSDNSLEAECLVAVPLLVSDRPIGVMSVRRQGEREFVPHDLELLTLFANQAAVAIENAELYQQLKDRAESLQLAYQQLEEDDRIKDEMIQNISHELRTPLTFVIGYLGLVIAGDLGPLTEEQHESLELVYEKANALTHMVNDIITLQTIRISQPDLVPVDILALTERAVEVADVHARQVGLRVMSESPSGPIYVKGQATRLAQVMENLLNNAIKFSPDGGDIRVHVVELADAEPDNVRVEVRDGGIGVPTDKLERVFDRFYQVDGTATRRFGGLGMGLAICKEIVQAMGGRIWVESPTCGDHGSTFYFTLQRVQVDGDFFEDLD